MAGSRGGRGNRIDARAVLCNAEVDCLEVRILCLCCEEEIFGLDVAHDNTIGVELADGPQNFSHNSRSICSASRLG